MNISQTFQKTVYWMTPPIIWRLLRTFKNKSTYKKISEPESFENSLDLLESQGLRYFFDDNAVNAFCRMKRELYLDNNIPTLKEPNLQMHLEELIKNGYTIIPDFLSKQAVLKVNEQFSSVLSQEINYMTEALKDRKVRLTSKVDERWVDEIKVFHNLYDGVIRMWNIEKKSNEVAEIDADERILSICKAYLGGTVLPSKVYLDVKAFTQASDSSLSLHGDSFAKICKVFIALEDGDDQKSPFLYFKGSHKQHDFKLLKDFLEFCGLNKKYHDHFNNYNILSMFKLAEQGNVGNIKPERIPLKAGDCIIVDTSGIHGATDLVEGRRVQLGMVYEQKGFGATDTFS